MGPFVLGGYGLVCLRNGRGAGGKRGIDIFVVVHEMVM